MSSSTGSQINMTLDEVLANVAVLKQEAGLQTLVKAYLDGDFSGILRSLDAQKLFEIYTQRLSANTTAERQRHPWTSEAGDRSRAYEIFLTGLAAFDAFLQANVTGPPLTLVSLLYGQDLDNQAVALQRERCLLSLSKDGLSVYQHIPHVELYCFARAIFLEYFPTIVGNEVLESRWMRIRINTYHQRLLSSGTSNARLSDSAEELQEEIEKDLAGLEKDVLGDASRYSTEAKVQFVLEKAQIYIMQGLDLKARENVVKAKAVSDFNYVLSGALGKRTKFQQTDISQLVVFAKSSEDAKKASDASSSLGQNPSQARIPGQQNSTGPTALDLNDDTLLESIAFTKFDAGVVDGTNLPEVLRGIQPDDQPQLKPFDQITLLTEATLKDTLSPLDKLNSEEILPFAVRVLSDKPTNWQIYTQALLVRSRIEAHRSRTQERSVLQLQAIVDQIIADTEETPLDGGDGIPQIQVTSFLRKPEASESAPVMERLKFVHQLNSPTRWEIESELAYAWSNAGSFLSALEIFKRLKLWPEVALCYHSVDQLDKAKQIVRRQLYHSKQGPSMDQYSIDANEVVTEEWDGEIRSPPPAHAPRLWCILGDLEQEPACWELAWEISNNRYARAQRTLGEYYSRKGDFVKARDAYMKATVVNRQNDETWSRLGDIDLKVGNWDGAIIAFQQSIMIDDHDAKTYSNLGSALLSKYSKLAEMQKLQSASQQGKIEEVEEDEDEDYSAQGPVDMLPKDILRQALIAYKKGASIAHNNWQIWDNVITIAGRMSPPSFPEILMAMRAIIRIRSPTVGEEAVDIDILRALVAEVITRDRTQNAQTDSTSNIYIPPRGSLARAVTEMVDNEIVPLITKRAALWLLVEKLNLYKRDYVTALSSAEKAWRIASGGEEWLEDKTLWKSVAETTDNLVSAFENYGPQARDDGPEVEKGWKGKARSAVRSILGKAKGTWEDDEEFEMLKARLEDLKNA